jgi:RNA ligase
MTLHISRSVPDLKQRLDEELEKGNVIRLQNGDLSLYCYSKQCVFDRSWNDVTISARGIILDSHGEIVATPFPKFFNFGEMGQRWPDEPFKVYEKLDGSLIIAFWHDGEWKTATKASFNSDQAKWAKAKLKDLGQYLVPGITYLFEAIYKENRIVVNYDFEDLVLLGAYEASGAEVPFLELSWFYKKLGFRCARTVAVSSFTDLMDWAKELPISEEGWVVRFQSGLRLKVKGEEYKRVHNLVSNLTPLAIWDVLKSGGDINNVRKDLPEEFIDDFDTMVNTLISRVESVKREVYKKHEEYKNYTDKEIGLSQDDFGPLGKSGLFLIRKGKEPSLENLIWEKVRPIANKMD